MYRVIFENILTMNNLLFNSYTVVDILTRFTAFEKL